MDPHDKQLLQLLSQRMDGLMDMHITYEEELEALPPSMSDRRKALSNVMAEIAEEMELIDMLMTKIQK